MSVYTLMHKDVPVLDCQFDGVYLTDVLKVYEERHVPVGCVGLGDRFNRGLFMDWWMRRSVPRTRTNMKEVESVLAGKSINSLAVNAYACNLSDQYWIRPQGSRVTYLDVNFFENEFSGDLTSVFLGRQNQPRVDNIDFISPDSLSGGNLPKAWTVLNKNRVLLKSTAGGACQEPYNEVIGSRLCFAMGIPHVGYSLLKYHNDTLSACPCCITKDEEIVTAFDITRHGGHIPGDNMKEIRYYMDVARQHGVSDIDKSISQMVAVDYLIRNEDRHWTNFGLIRDANTLEYLRPMPLFDFGNSLFYSCSDRDISSQREPYSKFSGMPLMSDLRFMCDRPGMNMERVAVLPSIVCDVLAESQNMTRARKSLLCDEAERRVESFMKYVGLDNGKGRGVEYEY